MSPVDHETPEDPDRPDPGTNSMPHPVHREDVAEPCLVHRIDRGQWLLTVDWNMANPAVLEPAALPDTSEPYADVVADAICAAEYAGVSRDDVLSRAEEIIREVTAEAVEITLDEATRAVADRPVRRLRIVKMRAEGPNP